MTSVFPHRICSIGHANGEDTLRPAKTYRLFVNAGMKQEHCQISRMQQLVSCNQVIMLSDL